nr:unnamed protein product [Callosobruchus chinensis]
MNRREEQKQAVSQALENQDQRISVTDTSQKHVEKQLKQVKDHVNKIVREELPELDAGEHSLTPVAPAFHDRHSDVVAKPYTYNAKRHGTFIICNLKTSHV